MTLILAHGGIFEVDVIVAFFVGCTVTIIGGWLVRKIGK